MKNDKAETAITTYNDEKLSEMSQLGMSRVDPADIRPPQILLVQGLSDTSLMCDKKGVPAKVGQYYHTGKLEVMDDFEAYILFAAKSKYMDKRNPNAGEKDQYKVIGAYGKDLSLFGMTFKSSSLYTLSGLFTMSATQKKPMFCFKLKFETKELTNAKGTWKIPVCRIAGIENGEARLVELEKQARIFDAKADKIADEKEEEENTDKPPFA